MSSKLFGEAKGQKVNSYTLKSALGIEVEIINYGATITRLMVPDRHGNAGDIVLGFDDMKGYLSSSNPYIGSVVGRYANRIANGRFTIDGKEYQVTRNHGQHCLHGGVEGFDKKLWTVMYADASRLHMRCNSADGEEGFPGNLETEVVYEIDKESLHMRYKARSDNDTVINLTNHSYFNLSGTTEPVLDHVAMINAGGFTEVDEAFIPTGRILSVNGTPLYFRKEKTIGIDLKDIGEGYDHNFVLSTNGKNQLAASVFHPGTGRYLEMFTSQPGVQFFTMNFENPNLIGKNGSPYKRHSGFCLETQHFPDSPNHPQFPDTVLRKGEIFESETIYRFTYK